MDQTTDTVVRVGQVWQCRSQVRQAKVLTAPDEEGYFEVTYRVRTDDGSFGCYDEGHRFRARILPGAEHPVDAVQHATDPEFDPLILLYDPPRT